MNYYTFFFEHRQPTFGGWAFNIHRGEQCLSKWNLIPNDVDVLVTHTPPVGHGDLVCCGERAGCVELLSTIQKRVKPKYHIFGHIHEGKLEEQNLVTFNESRVQISICNELFTLGYGITSDGKIIFINASTCDINYVPSNLPVVFDIPLPAHIQKI